MMNFVDDIMVERYENLAPLYNEPMCSTKFKIYKSTGRSER